MERGPLGLGFRGALGNHRWHSTTTAERVKELRDRLGLEVRCFWELDAPPKHPAVPKPAPPPRPSPAPTPISVPSHDPTRPPHDGSRTRVEARVVFPVQDEDADTTASPEAGRAWASGQLVFNAGQFESARSGFADYARDGESAKELRARVNRTILEDLEAKVLALRALHAKLRDMDAGESFGDIVAWGRPKSEML